LEKARTENVNPQFGFGLIVLLSILLAQLGGLLVVYVRFLLNPASVLLSQADVGLFEGGLTSNFTFAGNSLSAESKNRSFASLKKLIFMIEGNL